MKVIAANLKVGLNPCCNGCCSRSSVLLEPSIATISVSILVVMDVALADLSVLNAKKSDQVSILVVMDVALAAK